VEQVHLRLLPLLGFDLERLVIADDPAFARVELLQRIGLTEFALADLEDVVLRSLGDPVRLYVASEAYAKDEHYHLALRIMQRHLFAELASSADPTVPRAFWEMLYPFAWRAEVSEAADRARLDPYLVAAVVREESSYYPRAVSRAGARGLMQLMPHTARLVAGPQGLSVSADEGLGDPRTNLTIGAAFLGDLVREFGDPRVALVGYNAGPKHAREWWKGAAPTTSKPGSSGSPTTRRAATSNG
jgi:soluble lytic murein transglycosylase